MPNYILEPGTLGEPGELLSPEKGNKFEKQKSDGIYEYSIKPNGKRDKSRVKISYYAGDIFEGTLSLGKYKGYGKYTWQQGGVYEGNFERGKLSGKGKYTEPSGDFYEGDFKNNKYDGKGKYTWSDGSSFEGEFKQGKITKGTYTDKEGNVYSCVFRYRLNGERKTNSMRLIRSAQSQKLEKKEKAVEKDTSKDKPVKQPAKPKQSDKSGLSSKDKALITTIRSSIRGPEFKNLYSGASGKSEKSDRNLIAILNFFTGSDAEQIQRIFKTSKIYDASKGQEYLTDMINSVMKGGVVFTQSARSAGKGKQSGASASRGGAVR
ncbi:MAG: hypothetical protein HDQ88_10760 [Clostridia bacterium]|nr:hypothetical protein [Clostridia bacterium]